MAWFDCALRMPINANTGGITSAYNGLVLHHAVSNASELQSLFGTPGFGASAHFYVRQDGQIQQMVDTAVVAWAQGNTQGNATMASVETQGCASPPYADPMSDAMVAALARLYAEGNRRHGWPFQLANSQGARGFSYHRLWNTTACPCDVRVNRRQEILNRAQGAGPAPQPPPTEEDIVAVMTHTCRNNRFVFQVNKAGQLYRKIAPVNANPSSPSSYNNALVSQLVWGGNTDVKVLPGLWVDGDDNGVAVYVELDPTTVVRRYGFDDSAGKPSAADLP